MLGRMRACSKRCASEGAKGLPALLVKFSDGKQDAAMKVELALGFDQRGFAVAGDGAFEFHGVVLLPEKPRSFGSEAGGQ
jgi:hypothetical protein